MNWLILRDALNTACNITSATYKGVGGQEGWGVWRGRVSGLTMLVDTADQVVCILAQTDSHSSPDHTTRRADVSGTVWDHRPPY